MGRRTGGSSGVGFSVWGTRHAPAYAHPVWTLSLRRLNSRSLPDSNKLTSIHIKLVWFLFDRLSESLPECIIMPESVARKGSEDRERERGCGLIQLAVSGTVTAWSV